MTDSDEKLFTDPCEISSLSDLNYEETEFNDKNANHFNDIGIITNDEEVKLSNSNKNKQVMGYVLPCDISQSPDEGPFQPRLQVYPKTMHGPKSHSFCAKWFDKYPWLEYSISFNKAYCFACRHFSEQDASAMHKKGRHAPTVYATTGFSSYGKAHERMQRHNCSARHLQAMAPWLEATIKRENESTQALSLNNSIDYNNSDSLVTVSQEKRKVPTPKLQTTTFPVKEKNTKTINNISLPNSENQELTYPNSNKRINNIIWCTCSNCKLMYNQQECICCSEIGAIQNKLQAIGGNFKCITEHPGFNAVCLNYWVLQVAHYNNKKENDTPHELDISEKYRNIAYTQFLRWCWGYIEKDVEVSIPSCVLSSIRSTFQSSSNHSFPSLDDL